MVSPQVAVGLLKFNTRLGVLFIKIIATGDSIMISLSVWVLILFYIQSLGWLLLF